MCREEAYENDEGRKRKPEKLGLLKNNEKDEILAQGIVRYKMKMEVDQNAVIAL